MCGRFAFWVTRKRLKEEFDLPGPEDPLPEIPARYNIAPGTDIAAVRNLPDKPRELAMLRWGLIPSWARDKKTGYKMINARAESVMKKPAQKRIQVQAALPDTSLRLLRVAEKGREKAALVHHAKGHGPFRLCRPVGEMEKSRG